MRPPNAFITVNGKRAQRKDVEVLGASGWSGQRGLPGGGEAKTDEWKLLKLVAESSHYLF